MGELALFGSERFSDAEILAKLASAFEDVVSNKDVDDRKS